MNEALFQLALIWGAVYAAVLAAGKTRLTLVLWFLAARCEMAAPVFGCFAFAPFSLQQNGLPAPKSNIGGPEVFQAGAFPEPFSPTLSSGQQVSWPKSFTSVEVPDGVTRQRRLAGRTIGRR